MITHRRTTHEGLKVPPNATDGLVVSYILYGTTYSEYAKFRSAPPLFLEDEDIFQKSASVVQILQQFPIVPRRPIFDSPRNKKSFFSRRDSQSNRWVSVNYLYWIFLCNLASYSRDTKWRFSNSHNFVKNLAWHSFYTAF